MFPIYRCILIELSRVAAIAKQTTFHRTASTDLVLKVIEKTNLMITHGTLFSVLSEAY